MILLDSHYDKVVIPIVYFLKKDTNKILTVQIFAGVESPPPKYDAVVYPNKSTVTAQIHTAPQPSAPPEECCSTQCTNDNQAIKTSTSKEHASLPPPYLPPSESTSTENVIHRSQNTSTAIPILRDVDIVFATKL